MILIVAGRHEGGDPGDGPCPCPRCRFERMVEGGGIGPPDDAPAVPDAEVDAVVGRVRRMAEERVAHVEQTRRYIPGGSLWTRLTDAQRRRIQAALIEAARRVDEALEGK